MECGDAIHVRFSAARRKSLHAFYACRIAASGMRKNLDPATARGVCLTLSPDSLALRVVQRPRGNDGRVARAGDLDFPRAGRQVGLVHGLLRFQECEANSAAQRVAIRRRSHIANGLAVATHDLGVEHLRRRILDQDRHQAPLQWTPRLALQQRFLADEATGLLQVDGEAKAGLVRIVGVVEVVAVVAVTFLHAQAAERAQPACTTPSSSPAATTWSYTCTA